MASTTALVLFLGIFMNQLVRSTLLGSLLLISLAPHLGLAQDTRSDASTDSVAGTAPGNSSSDFSSGTVPPGQAGWRSNFFDEVDGQLDMSNLLAKGGFIPMPIIITEPAVDDGLGMAAYFVENPPPGSDLPPTRTILGGAVTGNGSWGGGIMRSGSFAGGRWLYDVAAATGLAVLDFHPGNRDLALRYNNDIDYIGVKTRYRFGDSGFSLGPSLRWRRNDINLDTEDQFPRIEELAERKIELVSLGVAGHFDNRDNPLTPTRGLNVVAEFQRFDEAIGSDADFNTASLFGAWFHSRDQWTFAAMADAQVASEDAPFFMQPDVNIRGLARNRYTGDEVLSSEIEIRRQLTPRWAAVGFGGYGRAFGNDDADAATWGGGVRYRIARKLGLDVGLDYAVGPEEEVAYIQFGHAWGMQMD